MQLGFVDVLLFGGGFKIKVKVLRIIFKYYLKAYLSTDEMPFYPIIVPKFNWDTLSNLIGHLKKALLPKSVKIIDL